MIPIVTQPCFSQDYEPLGAIIAAGESGKTHTLDSVKEALVEAAIGGTTHIFNMRVKEVARFGICHEATADCFRLKQISNTGPR